MEIIYRVYEIIEVDKSNCFMDSKKILCQEVCICENRNHFKEIMKDLYGENISFRNTTKLNVGDLFITIISENCYDTKKYIDIYKHKCKECGKEFLANGKDYIYTPQEYLIERESPTYFNSIKDELCGCEFCSKGCRDKFVERYVKKAIEFRENNDDVEDVWIDKNKFEEKGCNGYIYMISKKSTKEFYVGQTKYNPIFRWGQHLLTNRFNYDNIQDYVFEILEKVSKNDNILEREAYWINKKRNENPQLSLNIIIPKEKQPNLFDIESE